MFLIAFLVTLVHNIALKQCYESGDVLTFDWSPFAPEETDLQLEGHHFDASRRHFTAPSAEIESEFGVFEVITSTAKPRRAKNVLKLKLDEKLPDLEHKTSANTKNKVNNFLKQYLAKLYVEKYYQPDKAKKPKFVTSSDDFVPIDDNGANQESKIFDSSLWHLKNKTKSLASKFFSLFTVVQFTNSQCQADGNGGEYLGRCYHETECQSMNGTALGACADNYGVCCVFRYTCGATSNQNCTYFESPGYPNYDPPGNMVRPPATLPPFPSTGPTPDPRKYLLYQMSPVKIRQRAKRQAESSLSCTINVLKQNDNIQQFRIDFIDLELSSPTNGTCIDERLIISGQNVNSQVPPICGYNTGQHVYVDVSMLTGPLQLSVLSNTAARKRFKIRVCQIPSDLCTNSNNCLQYYTGVSGTISSFNYDQAVVNRSIPGYFNNLNYAICIRKEAGYCSITYSNNPAGLEYPFQFRNLNDAGQSTVPPGQAGVEIFNCPDDYIVIGGIRLCGDKFNDGTIIEDFTMNAPVTDTSAGPILIPVRTNQAVTGRGFKLFYTQNQCPN